MCTFEELNAKLESYFENENMVHIMSWPEVVSTAKPYFEGIANSTHV